MSVDPSLKGVLRERRSVRDFLPTPIPEALLAQILEDANQAPSWSNTQPYRVAIASGALCDRLAIALTRRYDQALAAQRGGLWAKLKFYASGGLPDGDFKTQFEYPRELQAQRRATGHGLYQLLGIDRHDQAARDQQMRRNFEFFGAPTALFVFVHRGLGVFSALDAGIWLQSLMLSAHAHGLATCAQGALATWAGPVRQAFEVPAAFQLICGVSIGYASRHPINVYNPGRVAARQLLLSPRSQSTDSGATPI